MFNILAKNRESTIIGDILINFDVARIECFWYSCYTKTDIYGSFTFCNELVLKFK